MHWTLPHFRLSCDSGVVSSILILASYAITATVQTFSIDKFLYVDKRRRGRAATRPHCLSREPSDVASPRPEEPHWHAFSDPTYLTLLSTAPRRITLVEKERASVAPSHWSSTLHNWDRRDFHTFARRMTQNLSHPPPRRSIDAKRPGGREHLWDDDDPSHPVVDGPRREGCEAVFSKLSICKFRDQIQPCSHPTHVTSTLRRGL